MRQSHDWKNKSLKSLIQESVDKQDGSRGDTLLLDQRESRAEHLRNKDMLSPTSNQSMDNIIESKYDPNANTNEIGVGFGFQERMRTGSSKKQSPVPAQVRQPIKIQTNQQPAVPHSAHKAPGMPLIEPAPRMLIRE